MSHTPGPWHVESVGRVVDYNHHLLANVHLPLGEALSTQDANSRLIAAAPDLLAVCEELLLVAGTYKPIDMYDWERVSAVIDRAKAALEKVSGEG